MRLLVPLILVGLLIALTFAFERGDERAELTLHYLSFETLDPTMTQASADVRVAYALFEGLCTFDPYDFTVQPGVAERWAVSDDGLTYTFYLRKDAKWSDGQPLTTRDFVTTWRQGMMPDFAPPYADFLMHVRGGKKFQTWCLDELARINALTKENLEKDKGLQKWVAAFAGRHEIELDKDGASYKESALSEVRSLMARMRVQEAEAKFAELVGVRAIDDHTLEVELETPCSYFLDLVASWPFFPLPEHVTSRFTRLDPTTHMLRRNPLWIKPRSIVSNGPYRLARWWFKREVLLEANEHFHTPQRVKSKTVRMVWFADDNTAYNAYASGLIDAQIGATPVAFMDQIIKQKRAGKRHDVHEATSFGTYYFAINNRPKLRDGSDNPFKDVRVRRAFTMVVDKRDLVTNVTRLHQKVSGVFVPPGSIPGYQSPPGQRCLSDAKDDDERKAMIAEARRLLAEAGYPGGMGLPKIEILYNSGGGHELVSQALAGMWERHLGVATTLRQQEWKVFLGQRNKGHFMLARSGWFGDYGDPTTFVDLFRTGHGNNDFGHSDQWYDNYLDAAAREPDPAKRMKMLQRAEQYVMGEKFVMLPLYQYKLVHLFDPDKVTGVTMHPRNLQMYHYIEVKR